MVGLIKWYVDKIISNVFNILVLVRVGIIGIKMDDILLKIWLIILFFLLGDDLLFIDDIFFLILNLLMIIL